ncbi:hypothetical protein QDD76_004936 [Burkholderia cepacia]|jgi:hypothetical protein|uniref:Lipoprotein n=1 Tax=Burkholderia contaminans TaxID=488447 RepID=A0ABD7YG70_9BURK|nr:MULTISPECIES: hypothetical protein [Burkholderia]EKS9798943.1 hypothetical protein [Burkholderia cepacia]EKS9805897.1 hypothetical protein [Burkholderia cepacia]EKS9813445.1 hypothetical protein [Burkholderia cepacia]EKS9820284.1 hypothetical protein [Burkholderia cepacia]EKS9828149.1 hypothetical protein [Burkholderia cepacia]
MIKIVCAGILSLFLAACHNGTEGVAGTYGVEEHGKVNPLVKVESAGDTYSLSEFRAGKWVPVKGVVKPFTQKDLETLTKHKVDVPVDGIQTNSFALIQVPKGWTDGPFTTRTGYFAILMFSPVELQKM